MPRTAGSFVSGKRIPIQLQARWGRTSGAGSPTLQGNLGIASISDAGTGIMDITFETPMGGTLYSCINTAFWTTGTSTHTSQTTPPTATALRVASVTVSAGTATDIAGATNGFSWLIFESQA